MSSLLEVSREALAERREMILERLGVTRDELERRARTHSISPEDWDALDELEGIEFLLGNG